MVRFGKTKQTTKHIFCEYAIGKLLTWSGLALQIMGALAIATPTYLQMSKILNRAEGRNEDKFVLTPVGPFLKSQVYEVPPNSRVEQRGKSIQIFASNGTTLKTAPLTSLNRGPIHSRALPSGYVALAYSFVWDSHPISSFTTSWSVPKVPESVTGQTIFIFNGLEPSEGDAILHPVLQYGPSAAGGGNWWAVSSWWVTGSGAFFTPPVEVSVNQWLTGLLTLKSITNTNGVQTYNYNSIFTGIPASSLSISSTRVLPLAFEALEIYSAQTSTGLPRGRTSMTNIDIVKQDGTCPFVNWNTIIDYTNGFGIVTISNSVPNGQVDIVYPLQ